MRECVGPTRAPGEMYDPYGWLRGPEVNRRQRSPEFGVQTAGTLVFRGIGREPYRSWMKQPFLLLTACVVHDT